MLLSALREGDIATGFGSRFSHLDLQCVEAARLMSIPQGCLGIGRNIRISRKACCGLLYLSVVITTREKPSECPLELILRSKLSLQQYRSIVVRARGRCRAAGTGAGAQQQTRAASCQEPTEEAQHRLVLLQFGESRSVAMSVYARLCVCLSARVSQKLTTSRCRSFY